MENKSSLVLPSIADVIFLTVFVKISLSIGKGLLNDGDTGYHIRAGEYILNTFSIPRHDIFSFISPPLSWTAHEWLSEVIMALVHEASGLTGLVIFFSFVIAATYSFLFKTLQINRGNVILAIFLAALAMVSSQIHWLARPHIFSLFLTVWWYYLLDAYQYKNKNYLYYLPVLMILWVNLHGGFIFGLVLLLIYLLGNVAGFSLEPENEKVGRKQKIKLLGLTSVACLLASLINPYGYNILLFPFKLTSNKFIMDNVREFLSPNFHDWMPFEYLLLLAIAIFAISRSRLNLIELTLILLLTHMSLYSARYIPLFAIITAPILLRQGNFILEQTGGKVFEFLKKRSDNIGLIDRSAKGYVWPVLAILVVCVLGAYGKVSYGFNEKIKPVAAVEFIKRENLKGNMFNNDEFGDYIIYAAWPEYKVFFDGRSDMYGSSKIKEYLKVIRVQPGWEKVMEKYDINWTIYNAKSVLSTLLMERDDWRLIYADEVANIFVKSTPENQPLLEKYPEVKLAAEEDSSNGLK